jgi:hypothetical protein
MGCVEVAETFGSSVRCHRKPLDPMKLISRSSVSAWLMAVSLLTASSAHSAVLAFNVYATDSTEIGFTPVSFGQTLFLSLNPATPVEFYPDASNLVKATNRGTGLLTTTPFTSSLLGGLGPVSISTDLYTELGFYLDYNSGLGMIHVQAESLKKYQTPDNLWHYEVYTNDIYTGTWPLDSASEVVPITLEKLTDMLTQHPVASWYERAQNTVTTDQNGFDVVSSSIIHYSGTATFVPEPATVALSFLGSVLLLRLRRRGKSFCDAVLLAETAIQGNALRKPAIWQSP